MNQKTIRKISTLLCIATLLVGCSDKRGKELREETAKSIIAHYYKNKHIDKSIVLEEYHRIKLDSVVMRLTQTNESKEVIQFIVNDYKLKYGMNK